MQAASERVQRVQFKKQAGRDGKRKKRGHDGAGKEGQRPVRAVYGGLGVTEYEQTK